MRCTVDAYVYHRIFKKYNYQKILEIGFYQGQTAGLLAEITGPTAQITCVDPRPRTDLFADIYHDIAHKIKLHKIRSQDHDYETYDCILIDGDKSFDAVSHDIRHSVVSLDSTGMILVNEYQKSSVQEALEHYMLPAGFVPFLRTDQTLFFQSSTVDRGDFLDFELPIPGQNFIRFQNITMWNFTVLDATTLPIFSDRMDYFNMVLKEFDV